MIKSIMFDLDDTLIWDHQSIKEAFGATCQYAAEKYDVNPESLEEAVRKEASALYKTYETYPFTQMIGINPFEGLWGNFLDDGEPFQKMKVIAPLYRKEAWARGLQAVGISDWALAEELAAYFSVERKMRPVIYEDTFYVLDHLKDHYQLLLLTNGSPDLQNTKLSITPELRPYFNHIVISGAFGKGKPDPSIFEHALSLMSLRSEEVVMVGDNLMTDILGASRAGIHTVWINRHGKKRQNEVIPDYEITCLAELLPILKEDV